jgi:hypothetical protein
MLPLSKSGYWNLLVTGIYLSKTQKRPVTSTIIRAMQGAGVNVLHLLDMSCLPTVGSVTSMSRCLLRFFEIFEFTPILMDIILLLGEYPY